MSAWYRGTRSMPGHHQASREHAGNKSETTSFPVNAGSGSLFVGTQLNPTSGINPRSKRDVFYAIIRASFPVDDGDEINTVPCVKKCARS